MLTGLVLKIQLITANEWQIRLFKTVPNKLEWYLQFALSHYHSYFVSKITPFYLIYTVKSSTLSLNMIPYKSCLLTQNILLLDIYG
jgi:hypothetical protein